MLFFFLRIIFISCCIWVGRSEVQIYVGYDTDCMAGALCIEDFQMRAFFCIIKPRSCIWFHLSVGIFSVVEHWHHQCFIWSTCLWAGLLRIFGGWKLIVFLSFTIDINTESRSGFSLLDFCCCYSCSHYPLWVNEYPSEAGFFKCVHHVLSFIPQLIAEYKTRLDKIISVL